MSFALPGQPIGLWIDPVFRSGPEHMALDEALLSVPSDGLRLRFYRWKTPEITIGVFVRAGGVACRGGPVTRRWTGGGVVEHGDDLTFSLAISATQLRSEIRAADCYQWIHESLARALQASGFADAEAEPTAPPSAPEDAGRCFAAPVAWDVIDRSTRTKIAGGAQRRSRAGLLHQGSVRLPPPWNAIDHPWIARFAETLAPGAKIAPFSPAAETFALAEKLRETRYAHPDWLARR